MTQRTKPPFRADQVGSILRTKAIHEARAKHEKGEITGAQLTEVENAEIVKVIKQQEDVGLQAITDGEYRRSFWHYDFYGMLDGVSVEWSDHGIQCFVEACYDFFKSAFESRNITSGIKPTFNACL